MNILIIGGLLVLAVVAIVGAVLLGMGEERAEKLKEKSAALPVQTSPVSQMLDMTDALPPTTALPPTISETFSSEDRRTTRQLAPSLHKDEHLVVQRSGQLSVPYAEEGMPFLNGQIDEITGELRALAQKAGELEQRLNSLSEMLESQHHSQNGATSKHSAFKKIEISSF